VRRDIQRSSNYVLGVVLFAVALFFAGMSTKLTATGLRRAVLVVGAALFLGTVIWIATFPVNVAV
jgi:predicted phage tail protein